MNKICEEANSNSIKELNQIRNKLNSSLKNTSSNLVSSDLPISSITKKDLKVGSKVYIAILQKEGYVTSLPNKSNHVQVQIGSAKLMLPINNISKVIAFSKESFHGSSTYKTKKSKSATTEINVIGYHVEEAIFAIDKYLDDCLLAKLNMVRIVHGKGTGALRKRNSFLFKNKFSCKKFSLWEFWRR